MLFRLSSDQNLVAVHAMLNRWNADADRFRRAAHAARKGTAPTSVTVEEAEEAREDILSLLDEIEEALQRKAPGTLPFANLLRPQTMAFALLESVTKSCAIFDRFLGQQIAGPIRIAHEHRVTAD